MESVNEQAIEPTPSTWGATVPILIRFCVGKEVMEKCNCVTNDVLQAC